MAIPFRLSLKARAAAVLVASSVGSVTAVQSRPPFWLTRSAVPSATTTRSRDSTKIVGGPFTNGPEPRIGGLNCTHVCPSSLLVQAPVAV